MATTAMADIRVQKMGYCGYSNVWLAVSALQ
jgi:hypothetical protein